MDNFAKLQDISLRLEQLESAGDWLARSLVHSDNVASQTGTLITVLVDDVRTKLLELVTELEKQIVLISRAC